MALYFDWKLQPPLAAGGRVYIDVDWHQLYPLLAVAVYDDRKGGLVAIYDADTQDSFDIDSRPQANVQVVSISWHPTMKVLAIGYESGEVVVWNSEENESFEGSKGHQAAVISLTWSKCGSVLVSADNVGALVYWQSDTQGHLQLKAHHDFKDPVCQIVFRHSSKSTDTNEVNKERTLGKMTSWRPKTGMKRTQMADVDNSRKKSTEKCFFVGLLSGAIFYVRDDGTSEEVLTSGSAVKSLLFHEAADMLIVMTEAYILGQFNVDANGGLIEVNKMKLSGQGDVRVTWAGSGTLAVITEELSIRLWDIASSENVVLEPPKHLDYSSDETFCSLDYHMKSGILCCGTNKGRLIMWRERAQASKNQVEDEEDSKWEWYTSSIVSPPIKKMKWCQNQHGILTVNGMRDVFILREQELVCHFGEAITAIQANPKNVIVRMNHSPTKAELQSDFHVRGIATSKSHICLWSGRKVSVYEYGHATGDECKLVGSFSSKCMAIAIHDLSLYLLDSSEIQVVTFQGTVKQTLNFTANEGDPITGNIAGEYLTVGTMSGYLKVWHIARREPKLHHPALKVSERVTDFGEIISAKNNANGTKIGFTIAQMNLLPDSRIFVWDINSNSVLNTEFPGKFVSVFFWDWQDPMLMCLEMRMLPSELLLSEPSQGMLSAEAEIVGTPVRRTGGRKRSGETGSALRSKLKINVQGDVDLAGGDTIVTLFSSPDKQMLIHSAIRKKPDFDTLIGLDVPFMYFTQKENAYDAKRDAKDDTELGTTKLRTTIERCTIKDFDCIDEHDQESRGPLVAYVYSNLIDDVDEALKAMKSIRSPRIWENMAKNCVKSRRLDIALICLAKMRNASAARAVREAMNEPEVEAQVAMLAVQLNLPREAEELYLECKRYDLLLHLYKISRQWDKAIRLCETHCRIHLKSTYHSYAKCLESEKQIVEAIRTYELAETHRFEVPRMLVEDPHQLEAYVDSKRDTDLFQWWAQYQESGGEIETALKYYELAKDWLSLVRLLCFCGDIERAAAVTERVNDKASCYHLAKTLEDRGDMVKAIHFLTKAEAYGSAIRICKENHMRDQLWSLALLADPSDQVDAARYFETKTDRPDFEKAIQLYHRAGFTSKALDLAFTTQQYAALQLVAKDLISQQGKQIDPQLLHRCAEFFVMNGQIEKALDMMAAAHRYVEAMDLCVEHNLPITEEIAERLTAPKGVGLDDGTRIRLLEKIGECLLIQGNYHLAAKKYTQAGNKIQAMKALLKSGDTEKIVFYANVCRNKDIYSMAANYLQTTNWRASTEVQQLIVQFYKKAKNETSLNAFLTSMNQVEDRGKSEQPRLSGSHVEQRDSHTEDDSDELVEEEIIEEVEEEEEVEEYEDDGQETDDDEEVNDNQTYEYAGRSQRFAGPVTTVQRNKY